MPMRVLVTGGSGHLGSEVCRALAEAGFEARAVDRLYRPGLPVRLDVADLLDRTAVYRCAEGCDAVVHLANYPHASSRIPAQQLYAENVTMNINVFQAAVDVGARKLVYSSSVQVFGGDRTDEDLDRPSCLPYLPLDGDLPTCPRNPYALSKEAGELQLKYLAALDEALSCTAIRFPYLVSERHLRWYRRMGGRRRWRHLGNLDEGFSYLTMPDAAALVAAVLERQPAGYHQLFPAAPDNALGMPVPEVIEKFYPGVPLKVPADRMESLVDITSITETLGWAPKQTNILDET